MVTPSGHAIQHSPVANVHKLKTLPPHTRAGDNDNAFRGGFRLWEKDAALPRAG
jgi:hypothetical protein